MNARPFTKSKLYLEFYRYSFLDDFGSFMAEPKIRHYCSIPPPPPSSHRLVRFKWSNLNGSRNINTRIFFKFFSSYFIQIDSGRYLGCDCDWGGDTEIVPIIAFFNKEKFRPRPWQKIFSLIGVGIGRLILWYWHKYSRRISMKKQGPAVQIGAACEKSVKSAYFLKVFNVILLLLPLQILDAWA